MVSTNPNTIPIKGDFIQSERQANAAINPGHLIELMSTDKVRSNTQAGVLVPRTFAIEQEYEGKEITDAYATDDTVIYGAFPAGAEVYAKLAASATAVVIGDRLEAKNDGTVGTLSAADTLVATGIVTDDDNAATTGLAIYLHLDELQSYAAPVGHIESITAGNADAEYDIGAAGPRIMIRDDNAANTGGLQLYFDEDAAATDSRWLVNNTFSGKDVYVIGSDGRALKITHDASASSNGVAIYYDDDAANEEARMLFVSPTNAAGSYTTDDEVGLFTNVNAVQTIAIAKEAVDNSGGSSEVFIRIELL